MGDARAVTGVLHHVELWVPDLERADAEWGWLLGELGYVRYQEWAAGRSWRLGTAYIVVERSPDLIPGVHERRRPGLNHLAFHVASREELDTLVARSPLHGWTLMFPTLHPYAGGEQHYAAYLENGDGFEVELVAGPDQT
ncbi:VOC family protein [Streptomyces sp. NPDC026673]|uniref:VOC family protein n=1 Tax=Streptomyces sp. NPDC026673 TaxID=3155724 RepID=UPI0033C495B3